MATLPPPIPVTILTGFLGAGKTTLLNHILKALPGKRVAIIQNEFGAEIGLEAALVVGADGQRTRQWLELPSGCVCCSVRGELAATVEALAAQAAQRFDHIVIETTGLADPGPVAALFWMDAELGSRLQLDAIVTVVDVRHVLQQLAEPRPAGAVHEARRQVALADRLVLNKTDLLPAAAPAAALAAITAALRRLNPLAPLLQAVRGAVDPSQILGIHAYDGAPPGGPQAAVAATACGCPEEESGHCSHGGGGSGAAAEVEGSGHHHHSHAEDIRAVTIDAAGHIDLQRFRSWLAEVLWQEEAGGFQALGHAASDAPPAPAPSGKGDVHGGGGNNDDDGDDDDDDDGPPTLLAVQAPADLIHESAATTPAAAAAAPATGARQGSGRWEVLRCKGAIAATGVATKVSLQAVNTLFEITVTDVPWVGPPATRLVFIGRGVDALPQHFAETFGNE